MRRTFTMWLTLLVLAIGSANAAGPVSKIIHNWTLRTPIGEFGYVEIGGDGRPSEGDFLFGPLGYAHTRIQSGWVLAGVAVFSLAAIAALMFRVLLTRHPAEPSHDEPT